VAARIPTGASLSSVPSIGSISATAVVFAPPTVSDDVDPDADADSKGEATSKQPWGKKKAPPSMVLEEDVNGYRGKHKKIAGSHKKRKGKKVFMNIQPCRSFANDNVFRTNLPLWFKFGILKSHMILYNLMIIANTKI
jgi:hypothetical protein